MIFSGPTSNIFVSQRLRLHYADWGNPDAPPLILQHGGHDHCRSWDWAARELAKDWHVIAPDLRGHGDSAWSPDAEYSMFAFVYDFAQLVHTLGHEQVTIVGHSLGGNIASRFTGLYPDKVRSLVNVEGLSLAPQLIAKRAGKDYADLLRDWITDRRESAGRMTRRYTTLEAAYTRLKEANSFLSDEQARHLTVNGASRNEDGTWSWKFDNYLNNWPVSDFPDAELERLWQAITCPVLLLCGSNSFAPNPERDGSARHFRNARVVEYENAGHWLHHDQLDRFLADVKAFI